MTNENKSIKTPMISVIVPVYNAEKYIERCVKSIMVQTCENLEIILINDGSNDSSGIICDKYAEEDRRIGVTHTKNNGVSNARNIGIQNSLGDYLIFIDADDWVADTYVQHLYEAIEKDSSDMAICGRSVYEEGILHEKISISDVFPELKSTDENAKALFEYYIGNNSFSGAPCKIFRKDLIAENDMKFDVELSRNEDAIFSLQYLLKCIKISVLENFEYHHWEHEECATAKPEKNAIERINYVYEKKNELIEAYGSNEKLLKSALYYWRIRSLAHAYYAHLIYKKPDNFKLNYKKMIELHQELKKAIKSMKPDFKKLAPNTRLFLLYLRYSWEWIRYLVAWGFYKANSH